MAEKKDIKEASAVTKKPGEAVYTAKELAAQSMKIFGCASECVIAALKAAKKESASVNEAKTIVSKFLRKEIR